MTISEAISKAIDNGYNQTKYQWTPWITGQIFMQKEFWQCLGKAMGWKVGIDRRYDGMKIEIKKNGGICAIPTEYPEISEWQYQWHRFIDHLSGGGTPESFFKELK